MIYYYRGIVLVAVLLKFIPFIVSQQLKVSLMFYIVIFGIKIGKFIRIKIIEYKLDKNMAVLKQDSIFQAYIFFIRYYNTRDLGR